MLGVEPGPALRSRLEAVLNHSPALLGRAFPPPGPGGAGGAASGPDRATGAEPGGPAPQNPGPGGARGPIAGCVRLPYGRLVNAAKTSSSSWVCTVSDSAVTAAASRTASTARRVSTLASAGIRRVSVAGSPHGSPKPGPDPVAKAAAGPLERDRVGEPQPDDTVRRIVAGRLREPGVTVLGGAG
ncbi:hypothetical protein ACQ4WX_01670 [Streptomyces lasalocidi]